MDLLTPAQIDQLRVVFSVFAAPSPPPHDGSLAIASKELTSVLHALGVASTPAEVDAFITRADTTGRGALDFDEFVQLMTSELSDVPLDEELAGAFAACDRDGDGALGVADVAAAVAEGAPAPEGTGATAAGEQAALTATDVQGIVFEMAGPDSKKVSLEQFMLAMKSQV
jgi:Ca2+-binding EF-hand superfamily protein